MARQRVIFISGVGNYVPGQVSSLKDAQNFVKGAGSIGNPLTAASKTSSGSLINPAVGAVTALAAGALAKSSSTLGIPQNLQNFISSAVNTGGLFVELLLNPQRISEDQNKVITKNPTPVGYAYFHWGLEPKKIKFELITRNLRPGLSNERRLVATLAQQNIDQLEKFYQVNNFNTGLIYKNKIYIGHFEGPFSKVRDVNNPNIMSVSFTFIIDKYPQVILPGLGAFDVNTIPVNI